MYSMLLALRLPVQYCIKILTNIQLYGILVTYHTQIKNVSVKPLLVRQTNLSHWLMLGLEHRTHSNHTIHKVCCPV